MYPNLFRNVLSKDCTIAEIYEEGAWELQCQDQVTYEMNIQIQELRGHLAQVKLK
jgi:hypothetical protein